MKCVRNPTPCLNAASLPAVSQPVPTMNLLKFTLICAPFAYLASQHLVPRAVPVYLAKVVQQPSSSYNVTKCSCVTSAELDRKLGGVLRGKGSLIVRESKAHSLDPLFVAGVIIHESGNGSSRYSKAYNNVAGIMNGKKPVKFASVDECIRYQIRLLAGKGYVKSGRMTIESIQKRYCPVGASNDPKGLNKNWSTGVIAWMNRIKGDSV